MSHGYLKWCGATVRFLYFISLLIPMTGESQEMTPLVVASKPPNVPLFETMNPVEIGVVFTNSFPRELMMDNALSNGSGVALGDFDGDGWCDVYLCNLMGRNGLFRNRGAWRFEDVTEHAGVGLADQESTGAVFADVNGDRRLDLIVTSMNGKQALYLNQGNGRFEDFTEASGIASPWGATSMALADVDRDGDLDLYVCNYGRESVLKTGGKITWKMVDGKPVVTGRHANRIQFIDGKLAEFGEPDQLYLNDGEGRFTAVPWTDGAFRDEEDRPLREIEWYQGLSVSFRDLNRDGWPDLYICNDGFMPDRIWMNRGDGTFRAIDPLAIRQTSLTSMGVDFADVDRDGDDDFLVADMLARTHFKRMTQRMADLLGQPEGVGIIDSRPQYRRNTFQLNQGDATFSELAYFAGLADSDWSWGVVFLDADLDGWEDLFITNGFPIDPEDKDLLERKDAIEASGRRFRGFGIEDYTPLLTPNVAFRNKRDTTFEEAGGTWGFDSTTVSYGLACADLDRDGDLDLVVNTLNAAPLFYQNHVQEPRLAVRLSGISRNGQGIGARIEVEGGPVRQSQEVISGGRYMSGDDPLRVFAANRENLPMTVRVDWPSGKKSILNHVMPNSYLVVKEENAVRETESETEPPPREDAIPWFVDRTAWLNHRHMETAFDDFALQPSLNRKVSQDGPGLVWYDLDRDGWDDLLIGEGRGGNLKMLRNLNGKSFQSIEREAFQVPSARDVLGLVVVGGDSPEIFAAYSNYETGFKRGMPSVLEFDFKANQLNTVALEEPWSLGTLAMADIDGDGDLDLFVAGRILPGRFPLPATSRLLLQTENGFTIDPRNARIFQSIGLITGAVFTDIDNDSDPDLIVSRDWGSLMLFENESGRFVDRTESFGLSELKGRWSGIATGDFNNDGLTDLVAGNLGLNTRESLDHSRRFQMVAGDFQSDGIIDAFTFYERSGPSESYLPLWGLERLQSFIPGIRRHFKTHADYAAATSVEINKAFESKLSSGWEINTLESTVFLNQGGRFAGHPMPSQAQWSPLFGMAVGDFNADGQEDVFCAQNFFANYPNTDRYAAGRGLLLVGDGTGRFEAIDSTESGIFIPGEQRGVAVGDFNQDNKADIAVGQNGAETRLFENQFPQAGIRVKLIGPPGNPDAIGSALRLNYRREGNVTKGPKREIQAGNGYLSQNSTIQILGSADVPIGLEIWWPDGLLTRHEFNETVQEHTVTHPSNP